MGVTEHPDNPGWVIAHAPIKLNLFLHITGRRSDGYHDLQTYFQLIDHGDELQFSPTADSDIQVDWIPGTESVSAQPQYPEDDLIYRAAALLQQQGLVKAGAHIRLIKNAPVGGGVGGGSAAAATVLLVLNELWGVRLPESKLIEIGRALGADVPVFIHGKSCLAEGIGDRFIDVSVPSHWYVVVDTGESISTSKLFSDPDLVRDMPKVTNTSLALHWQTQGCNVFEPILLKQSAKVRACFDELHQQAGFARLTGTGGCLFAPVPNQQAGLDLAKKLLLPKRVIVCQALDHFDPMSPK